MKEPFIALQVEQNPDKTFQRRLVSRTLGELPPGALVVRVQYSSLNYKDALSATGHPGVTRNFPHTPGIDAAGVVENCDTDAFRPGDRVIVTGYDLGMETDGGFGQVIRIPADWVVPCPAELSLLDAMTLGTAGFTAALSIYRMQQNGVAPGEGDILVTGATGGVGSLTVVILAKLGYRVTAATGKSDEAEFLRQLGAAAIIGREEVLAGMERAMLKERWAGVVDCVGGSTLAAALKATRYGGTVTCCGLVGSADLPVNVFPFILRGVSLLGIDSVQCPMALRRQLWDLLAGPWKPALLPTLRSECGLTELEERIQDMLQGKIRGRTVVNLQS